MGSRRLVTAHVGEGFEVSDNGLGAERVVAHIDHDQNHLDNRTRWEYVSAHLTHSQHELFTLMSYGWSREEIMRELHIAKDVLSHRESVLMKKIKKLLEKDTTHPPSGAT